MRYLLIILSLTGGLLSFNSYAASCPVGATVPAGTYKPFYQIKHSDGTSEKYINIGGCEYWAKGGAVLTPDGFAGSLGPWVSTGNHVKDGVSPAVDENGHSPEPEAPPSPLCLTLNRQILILSLPRLVAALVVVRSNLICHLFFLQFHPLMRNIYIADLYFIMIPVLHGILILLLPGLI